MGGLWIYKTELNEYSYWAGAEEEKAGDEAKNTKNSAKTHDISKKRTKDTVRYFSESLKNRRKFTVFRPETAA